MRERFKKILERVLKWVGSNISWEILSWLGRLVLSGLSGKIIIDKLPNEVIVKFSELMVSFGINALDYLTVFIVISGFIYGIVSFVTPPLKWMINFFFRSEKPHFVQDNEWNAVINRGEQKSLLE